jgi:rhodanese-related sulfurtransferase
MRLGNLVVIAVITSCTPSAAPPPPPSPSTTATPDRIDGATAHSLVHEGATLVDVRTPEEFASKHIDGAVNVPIDEVSSHDFGSKDKPLVLYCARGHRSQQAGETLRSQGYTRVYVLGAMSAWGP